MVSLANKYPRWHRRRRAKPRVKPKSRVKRKTPGRRTKSRPKRKSLMRRIDDALLAKTSAPVGFRRMYMQPYRPPAPPPPLVLRDFMRDDRGRPVAY